MMMVVTICSNLPFMLSNIYGSVVTLVGLLTGCVVSGGGGLEDFIHSFVF